MVEKARMIPWLWAIYVSVLLWLAVAIGNIALFALRPAEHWPVLETIEGLQTASLIPIALLLHRINRRSGQSAVVTVVGTLAMLLGAVLSFAFASELLTFGPGMIAVFGGILALVGDSSGSSPQTFEPGAAGLCRAIWPCSGWPPPSPSPFFIPSGRCGWQ